MNQIISKKILILSTGDTNGAYEAMYKLSCLLIDQGYQVIMMVKNKTKSDDFIIKYKSKKKIDYYYHKIINYFKSIKLKIKNKNLKPEYTFISKNELTINISSKRLIKQIGFIPEFIFTGMTDNFMNSTDLLNLYKLTKAEIYNISVDMNHFTGGCHFAWDCKGYINGCTQNCDAIINNKKQRVSQINFETKLKNAKQGNFKIITGSGWTLKQAKESKIYKNQQIIYNLNSLIDTNLFTNKHRNYAKNIFNLDSNKFYILMGCQDATDIRKGFIYLKDALKIVYEKLTEEQKKKVEILIVSRKNSNSFEEIPFNKKFIKYLNDYRLLALLYQSVDVFINSSIEDSGPMMVSEALACGTPVVGFDMGVVNNMVINGFNGYKAILKDSYDLAKGIEIIINLSKDEYSNYSNNAINQIEKFSSHNYCKDIINKILYN